jgi:hypothetical protein
VDVVGEEKWPLGGRQEWGDRERLLWLGERLDGRSPQLLDGTVGMWLSRCLLQVRERSGHFVPLVANAVQRAYEQRRGRQNIVLKARQMGLSTWIAGRFFLKTITQPGTLTVQVAQNREAAEQMFQMVHRFYERLPEGVREGVLRTSRANAGQMVFPGLDSEYRVLSAADGNAGRGLTVQNLHCSEVAHWAGDGSAVLAGLRAALAPGGELVLESTANGAQGCFYEEWCGAEASGMVRHFFPWWMEAAYVGAPVAEEEWTAEERGLVAEHGLRAEQIGFRREMKARFRRLAGQEYAENAEGCFLTSGACVFDLGQVEARMRAVPGPLETRENGGLHVWYPAQPGREYIVGVDPAGGGTEGDFACAQVIERKTGLQCAELQAHLGPRELAKVVARLGREYNGALLVVERNNHGMAVLAHLGMAGAAGSAYSGPIYEQRGQAGWLTTAVSRPGMLERLGALLEEGPEIFMSRRLLAECRSFVRKGDGRTEAAAGAHDDCVLAMAMAQAVRAETGEHSRNWTRGA